MRSAAGKEKDNILTKPEGYDDMVKKLEEREQEQLSKALARKKVESLEDLKNSVTQALAIRAGRTKHEPLKDRKILTESQSREVSEMKEKIQSEIAELAKRVFKELTNFLPVLTKKVSGGLKGRIQKGPPSSI